MQFLKREWKAIIITLWLVAITIFLFSINGRLGQLQRVNSKIASTLDSVESVAISTDSNTSQTSKKVDDINANVSFIVEKIRRH
ncbi:MAG: hypothetical protein M0036_18645 [Desulfobacteraceae bacterium]|nr:hypothetical protein [Desulfobacteraceae bacterium]